MTISRIATAGLSAVVAFTLSTSGYAAASSKTMVTKTDPGSTSTRTRPVGKYTDSYAWNRNSDPSTLILKLDDKAGAALSRGWLYTHHAKNRALASALEYINQLVSDVGGKLAPALPVSADTLTKRRIEAQQNTNARLADLTQYFRISLPKGAPAKALLDALAETAYVELAYASMRQTPDPGDIAPATPSFFDEQTYATAAPLGIDVDYVNANTDIRATDVTIADVEQCWTLTHEDLMGVNADPNVLVGDAVTEDLDPLSNDCSHGTAVLGILAADDDAFGITGLVPEADIRVATVRPEGGIVSVSLSRASALSQLALVDSAPLEAGDVILIEQQAGGPHWDGSPDNCYGCVPIEYDEIVFDVIRLITALNIHVVEAGGNGSQDLDNLVGEPNPGAGTGSPQYSRFRFDERYSGAIVTGAASADILHTRLDFSNYGGRVDAFSWGEDIATTGYGFNLPGNLFPGVPDVNQWYTPSFGGTSGASPIVTSAVALLQAQHKDLYQSNYLPDALRLLLRTTGTPSFEPDQQWIGHQPDLKLQTELVRSGPNLAAVLQGDGDASNGRIGEAIAYVGDQDDDSFGDIAVAENDVLGGDATIHIYSGITGQPIQSIPLEGLGAGVQTISLANAGDADGDGRDDLLVGQASTDVSTHGKVIVLTRLATFPDIYRTYSGAQGSRFGFAVAAVDDLNGDGHRDYLAGAPEEAGFNGALYILSGAANDAILEKKYGPDQSQYGYAVTALKDWNGDGRGDFAVGAPDYLWGRYGKLGRVLVYDGPSMSLHDAHFCNFVEDERCGEAVADAGDLTGDGNSEVLIGAPGGPSEQQGQVFAYSQSYGYIASWTKPGARDFGANLISIDCDSCTAGVETFITSSGDQGFGSSVHRLPALSGPIADDYLSPGVGSGYGKALAGGDINNDGRSDLIIGDPNSERVYVYLK